MALPAPVPGVPVAVTGASSGIGEALAGELAARGHDVLLVARREERLRTLAEELRLLHGVTAEVRAADLAAAEDRDELAAELAERELAGLCNNAGIGSYGPYLDTDPDHVAGMIAVNTVALNALTAAVLPGMARRGAGAVLNVASILGHGPQPLNAAYAATKAFAIALSEAVHAELAGSGVSVSVLSPGPVRTDIYGPSSAETLEDIGPGFIWQEPEDVARAGVELMERGGAHGRPGPDQRAGRDRVALPAADRQPPRAAGGRRRAARAAATVAFLSWDRRKYVDDSAPWGESGRSAAFDVVGHLGVRRSAVRRNGGEAAPGTGIRLEPGGGAGLALNALQECGTDPRGRALRLGGHGRRGIAHEPLDGGDHGGRLLG